MSFRLRQTLATALAVAVAVAAASAVVYVLIRNEQRGQVEEALRERAEFLTRRPLAVASDPETGGLVLRLPGPPGPGLEPGGVFVQAVRSGRQHREPRPEPGRVPHLGGHAGGRPRPTVKSSSPTRRWRARTCGC